MTRPIKPQNRYLVDKVTEALTEERRARERAEETIRQAIADARVKTNQAIFEATEGGVTKASLQVVLGISYTTIYNREQEHKQRIGYTAPVQDEPASIVRRDVVVERDAEAGTITVRLDGFTHPDVGTDVTGTVMYDEDGDLKIGDAHIVGDDPLAADRLWATREVQDALHA